LVKKVQKIRIYNIDLYNGQEKKMGKIILLFSFKEWFLKKELLQNNMADKNITPKSKSKPLSKKERKEQKKKRKHKQVLYE